MFDGLGRDTACLEGLSPRGLRQARVIAGAGATRSGPLASARPGRERGELCTPNGTERKEGPRGLGPTAGSGPSLLTERREGRSPDRKLEERTSSVPSDATIVACVSLMSSRSQLFCSWHPFPSQIPEVLGWTEKKLKGGRGRLPDCVRTK